MSVSIAELTDLPNYFWSTKSWGNFDVSTPDPSQPAMDLDTLSMSSTRCPHSVQRLIVQIPRALTLCEAKEWMLRENTWGARVRIGNRSVFVPACLTRSTIV
jgi:hypothetical protein